MARLPLPTLADARRARSCLPSLVAALLLLPACSAPGGLRATPEGDGPHIVVDWDAEPLPEIPFPNDLALRLDATSPTGVRLNFSEDAPTELERRARRHANRLTGFGIFSPITVKFDAPLDLDVIADRQADDGDFLDDAIFVLDVTPGSPTYLQASRLDLGHGRFPGDLFEPGRYFPNDVHADVPSLLFDTHQEDLDGNGLLGPGEDIDGDGHLDVPNVYPEGGDPREDLLTWYERETNSLILRPILPLREETTYAVLLTERLVGEDGQPVRSPWPFVNHTRQTADLQPALDALPAFGLTVEDVAFAWTFTTAQVTRELLDVRLGLDAQGPYAHLRDAVPPRIDESLAMHEIGDLPSLRRLPVHRIIGVLGSLGLFPPESRDQLLANYEFADAIVGGVFTVPWFMVDRDDGGRDTSDEVWELDPLTGAAPHDPVRVTFTCVLPKPDATHQQPFPVVNYGHGYGSSRVEFLGFAWSYLRLGIAACAFDYPGHGLGLDPDEREQAATLLSATGLGPFLDHLESDRARDLDNDGVPNSGADQWTSDGFHTRDMVRQGAVDHLWFARALQACGTGTMSDANGDGRDEMACDWDADGVPDIGGPDVPLHLVGGSLGGINTAVAAGVAGDLYSTIAPIVGGAGLMDVGWRSALGGVREAAAGRVISPFFYGTPNEDGTLRVTQMVVSATRMKEFHVGTLAAVPAGGRLLVENLDNGESNDGPIPADGRFRVAIAADAPDPIEKQILAGMPATGPVPGVVYALPGNLGLGDEIRLRFFDADGAEVATIDALEAEAVHEGITMAAGSPLVAGSSGLGHQRGSPRLRRIVNVLSQVTEPGDPIAYARHYFDEPFVELGGVPLNILLVPTTGDEIVPVATEIALGRAAGLWDLDTIDPRFGVTVDRHMIDREILRGDERWGSYTNKEGEPILFDLDDLDGGVNQFNERSDAPLRATRETTRGIGGMRVPYVSPRGTHAFSFPLPTMAFDIHTFAIMQIATYGLNEGQEIIDDPCLADLSCAFLRALPEGN